MTKQPILLIALLAIAAPAAAQTDPRSAAASAKAFSLDLPATPAADPTSPPPLAHADPDLAPTAASAFTLDTPIAQLLANARAKAVVDRDLPGLSGDENLGKFEALSLRQFQPMTGGQMSDSLLAKLGNDLAAIGPISPSAALPPPPALMAPLPTVESNGKKKIDSGR